MLQSVSICFSLTFRYIPLFSWPYIVYKWTMSFPISGAAGANRLHGQGFREKYRSRNGEDDFFRKPEGMTLPVEEGGSLSLPVNWNDRVIFSYSRISGKRVSGWIPYQKRAWHRKRFPFFLLTPWSSGSNRRKRVVPGVGLSVLCSRSGGTPVVRTFHGRIWRPSPG